MKWLACALVTIALCAAAFAGDLGWIDKHDAHNWSVLASWALGLFAGVAVFSSWGDR